MNRADRVLALFAGKWTAEGAIEAGVTVQDADDAHTLALLDLEMEQRLVCPTFSELVARFIAHLGD